MADNLYHMDPPLHFPIGKPFEVPDQFNGHQRGTFYFRSILSGDLYGPFKHFAEAAHQMINSYEEDLT